MDDTEDPGLGVSTKSGVPSSDDSNPGRDVGVSLEEAVRLLLVGRTGVEKILPEFGGGHDAVRL